MNEAHTEEAVRAAEVEAMLRHQAGAVGRVRLPKRGTTKPYSAGRLGMEQRRTLAMARKVRAMRKRWAAGRFTDEERAQATQMAAMLQRAHHEQSTPEGFFSKLGGKLAFWRR